jgi:hypothetical protein
MRPMAVLGIVLLVLGILAFAYQGVLWVSSPEPVAKIGPIEVWKETAHPIPLAPILGGIAIAAGVVLLAMGSRRPI